MELKLTKEAMEQIDQYSRDRVGISTLERYADSSAIMPSRRVIMIAGSKSLSR